MAPHQEHYVIMSLLGGVSTGCGHHERPEVGAGRRLLGWEQRAGCSGELMHVPAGSMGRCPMHLGTASQENGGRAELGNTCNGDAEQIWS